MSTARRVPPVHVPCLGGSKLLIVDIESSPGTCPCGADLPARTGAGRPRTYCSPNCRSHYHKLGHRAPRREPSTDPSTTPTLSAYAYAQLLVAQENKCLICGTEEVSTGKSGKPKRLAADHCHETGKVRGLLCQRCNVAIGLMDDDPARLVAAAAYLEQHTMAAAPTS